MQKQIINISIILCLSTYGVYSQATKIQDIQPGINSGFPSTLATGTSGKNSLVVYNNEAYFTADDGIHGQELWRTDGNTASMVKDINPGATGSVPMRLLVMNGSLYFFADDGVHGDELWKSDGTEAGTVLVKDVNPGVAHAIRRNSSLATRDWLVWNNTLYFSGDSGNNYSSLWKSDGTEAGTVLVKNVCGSCNANNFSTSYFVEYNNLLYFISANVIYKSNGTTAGTSVAFYPSDINMGIVSDPIVFNGKIYLRGGGVFDPKLYATDGTESGTQSIATFGVYGGPRSFRVAEDKLYFFANNNTWVSNGTSGGTKKLSDDYTDNGQAPSNTMFDWLGSAWFTALASDGNFYVYRSNDTQNGTVQFGLQNDASNFHQYVEYESDNNYMYFGGIRTINGVDKGIIGRHTLNPPTYNYVPVSDAYVDEMVLLADNLIFRGYTEATGYELWKISVADAVAQITAPAEPVCSGTPVVFSAVSGGGEYLWNFGTGATPATAVGPGPHNVTFSSAGNKSVTLIAKTAFDTDTASASVTVQPATTSVFNFTQAGLTFQFTSNAAANLTVSWDFGDGSTSDLPNPSHTFPGVGTYTVVLTVTGPCGTATSTKTISITSGVNDILTNVQLSIFPNPAETHLYVNGVMPVSESVVFKMLDMQGRTVVNEPAVLSSGAFSRQFDVSTLAAGNYILQLQTNTGVIQKEFIVH